MCVFKTKNGYQKHKTHLPYLGLSPKKYHFFCDVFPKGINSKLMKHGQLDILSVVWDVSIILISLIELYFWFNLVGAATIKFLSALLAYRQGVYKK